MTTCVYKQQWTNKEILHPADAHTSTAALDSAVTGVKYMKRNNTLRGRCDDGVWRRESASEQNLSEHIKRDQPWHGLIGYTSVTLTRDNTAAVFISLYCIFSFVYMLVRQRFPQHVIPLTPCHSRAGWCDMMVDLRQSRCRQTQARVSPLINKWSQYYIKLTDDASLHCKGLTFNRFKTCPGQWKQELKRNEGNIIFTVYYYYD